MWTALKPDDDAARRARAEKIEKLATCIGNFENRHARERRWARWNVKDEKIETGLGAA